MENSRTLGRETEKIPHLPQEIIEEILKYVPVNPLLRFKSVSKSWLALISSPQFVKSHLKTSSTGTNLARDRIMFLNLYANELYHASLHSLLDEPGACARVFNRPVMDKKSCIMMVSSCNGLICIRMDSRAFILWNPSTRKSKRLPEISDDVGMKSGPFIQSCGFGFDESTDDYKVFAVMRFAAKVISKVYSLKSNSWKSVDYHRIDIPRLPAYCVGSKIYWVSIEVRGRPPNPNHIEFFDLKNEVFGEVKPPCDAHAMTLCVIDGCICAYCYYYNGHGDAWVLRRCGVDHESWEKLFSVPYVKGCLSSYREPPTFCFDANGEILLSHGDDFLAYRLSDRSFRRPEMGRFVEERTALDVYTETLVSLDNDDDDDDD